MQLKLERPLSVFDLETTGVRIGQDRIVQIAIVKLMPDGSREELSELVDPEMAIPAEATAIHGITDHDVSMAPTLLDLAPQILAFLKGSDLAGYNIMRFDIPFLTEEMQRIKQPWDSSEHRFVDAMKIFHQKERRDLAGALMFYCGKEHNAAHNALGDVNATIDVLLGQLDRYKDLPRDVAGLGEFSGDQERSPDPAGKLQFDQNGRVCCGFGKHKGRPISELATYEQSYVNWMLTKAELPASTRAVIQEILRRIEA